MMNWMDLGWGDNVVSCLLASPGILVLHMLLMLLPNKNRRNGSRGLTE